MKFGYARVSHHSQNEARQLTALSRHVEPKNIFVDKFSGKSFDRPQYQLLKKFVLRDGDELFVTSLDRLGRDKAQLSEELRELKMHGVTVRILDVPTTMQEPPDGAIAKIFFDMMSQIMIEIMSALAESERILIHRRQVEGIAEAKRTGKTKTGRPFGRPRIPMPKKFPDIIALVDKKVITAKQARAALNLKTTTFYKLLAEYRKSNEKVSDGDRLERN